MLQILRDVRNFQRFLSYRWNTRGTSIDIPDHPIFAPADDAWFREALSNARFYLEFGSGASTLLAAQAGISCLSVESDPHFAEAVKAALPENHDVQMIAGKMGLTGGWGYPVFQRKSARHLAIWQNYTCLALDDIRQRGRFPDLVLIDGRFRAACALAVANAAGENRATVTIMFDDYRERPHYHFIEQYLGAPKLMENAAIFVINDGKLLAPIPADLIVNTHLDYR